MSIKPIDDSIIRYLNCDDKEIILIGNFLESDILKILRLKKETTIFTNSTSLYSIMDINEFNKYKILINVNGYEDYVIDDLSDLINSNVNCFTIIINLSETGLTADIMECRKSYSKLESLKYHKEIKFFRQPDTKLYISNECYHKSTILHKNAWKDLSGLVWRFDDNYVFNGKDCHYFLYYELNLDDGYFYIYVDFLSDVVVGKYSGLQIEWNNGTIWK